MKRWYKSKTIWFNALAGVLIAIESVFHVLQDILGPTAYPLALVLVVVVNGFLRVITTQEIGRQRYNDESESYPLPDGRYGPSHRTHARRSRSQRTPIQ